MNDFACGELLALDPGLNKPGVALFRGGKLVAAERVKIDPEYKDMPFAERCGRVAADILRWGAGHDMNPRTFAYELPQFYDSRKRKTKGDPNDLRCLIAIAHDVAGALRLLQLARGVSLTVLAFEPSQWTGNVPKATTGDPWSSPRGQRVGSRLSHDEAQAVVSSHDAIDAVGVGLFAMGRLDLMRVLPGAV